MKKFKILLDDGTYVESHDKMWNEIKDHSHFLPPNNDKKWLEYSLIVDGGPFVTVSFETGIFNVNGQIIYPAHSEGEILADKTDLQDFPVTKEWQLLNGMPYFPVVGTRKFRGELINLDLPFCGWKRKEGERTIQKLAFLYPDNKIVLT